MALQGPVILILSILLLLLFCIIGCYFWIKWDSAPYVFDQIKDVPDYQTALVLGTARFTSKGGTNLFYHYRIEAARIVFLNHKAGRFIVSGAAKKHEAAEEAGEMKASLIASNFPENSITTDHEGYRTWDSLWRCLHTYKISSVLIISQRFHNERAVFIGRRFGMKLSGFNAFDVGGRMGSRMLVRESLARVKCILDCYLLKPKPRYLRHRSPKLK